MSDSVRRDLSSSCRGIGTLLAGTPIEDEQRSVEELLEGVLGGSREPGHLGEASGGNVAEDWRVFEELAEDIPVSLRIWKRDLSPGTKYRLAQKRKKLEKEKKEHYKIRRKEYRRLYWKYLRPGNIARKKARTSTPLGLYKYYKDIANRKKIRWAIEEQEMLEILNTPLPDGVAIHNRIFNVVRIDKDKAVGYTPTNIQLVDRYTKELLYTPAT